MKVRACIIVSSLVLALVGTGLPRFAPASAATTITVDTSSDTVVDDGQCSLREAVQAANTNAVVDTCPAGSGADTIVFAPALDGQTTTLGSGLDVTSSISIRGRGRTKTFVAGDFINTGPGTSRIEHMTLKVVSNEPGTLTLFDVKVTGAVQNNTTGTETSTLHITDSQVVSDVSNNSGFGTSTSILTISRSRIGGIIDNNSGSGTTSRLLVSRSKTGEIDNNSSSSITTATIKNTTVSIFSLVGDGVSVSGTGTTATITGSTIFGFDVGVDTDGKTKILNSSIVGNISENIEVNGGTTTVLNSTVTKSGLGIDRTAGTVKLTNSIVALSDRNCQGTVGSGGGNISDDGSCHFTKSHDHNNKNPKLGTLARHGGPTQTQLPLKGSPAIDGGLNGPCLGKDQRGKNRPQDGNHDGIKVCDVGSVEILP
jgi:CSLREA domain-containing protein